MDRDESGIEVAIKHPERRDVWFPVERISAVWLGVCVRCAGQFNGLVVVDVGILFFAGGAPEPFTYNIVVRRAAVRIHDIDQRRKRGLGFVPDLLYGNEIVCTDNLSKHLHDFGLGCFAFSEYLYVKRTQPERFIVIESVDVGYTIFRT